MIICELHDTLEKWVNLVLSRCIFQTDSVCRSMLACLLCWCVVELHTQNEWNKGIFKAGAKRNACTLVLTCVLKKFLLFSYFYIPQFMKSLGKLEALVFSFYFISRRSLHFRLVVLVLHTLLQQS